MSLDGDEPLIQLDDSNDSQHLLVNPPINDTVLINAGPSEDVLCAFVCQFHVKRGNIIEWSHPSEFDLKQSGIEFKCIPSGAHLIQNDCVYFKFKDYFGISVFRNVPLPPSISRNGGNSNGSADSCAIDERGSRMKSVGFICKGTDNFVHYKKFLFSEVVKQCQAADPNQPSQYDHLKSATESQRAALQDSISAEISNPNSGLSTLLDQYGVKLLVLWKLSLLNYRLILYSCPPVEKVCCQLFAVSQLSANTFLYSENLVTHTQKKLHEMLSKKQNLFFLSLLDFSSAESNLKELQSYLCCTSDKVVEETMQGSYDVFIDGSSIRSWRRDLSGILKPTKADYERYNHLKKLQESNQGANMPADLDTVLAHYFIQLNNQILEGLSEASEAGGFSASGDNDSEDTRMIARNEGCEITEREIIKMGLNPFHGDDKFVIELIAQYGMDLVVVVDTGSCCPLIKL